MDYTFPDWNASIGGMNVGERDRPGAQGADPSGSQSPGATGTISVGFVQGSPCVRLINANGLNTGPTVIFDGGSRLHLNTLASQTFFSALNDDYAVHRVYAMMRVAATPTDATDTGIQIILGGNAGSGILHDAVPGVGIQFDTTGGCSYIQHGNSGAQTSQVLVSAAQGFINTNYHKMEFVFVNATPQANGQLIIKVDDRPLLTKNFGSVPDDLPLPSSPGANINNGYVCNLHNYSRNGEIDFAYVRCQRGPSLAAVIS